MSEKVKNNIHYLNVLASCNSKQRNGIIEGASDELIDAICECIDHALSCNADDSKHYEKMRISNKKLRKLRDIDTSTIKKKKILVQEGGLLPALLSPLIAIAGSLLGRLTS